MQSEGFRVTGEYEADHWWFRSRRDLFVMQVRRAAQQRGFPERRMRLLDFGCGTGFNLTVLSEFGDVSGADRFRDHDRQYRRAHDFPMIDVERDLPAHAGEFDLITALDVLEHIEDDVEGLRMLGRLLKPGGQVVLTVPAYAWLWGGEDVISEHKRRYTLSGLLQSCAASGMHVEYASYFNLSILPAMTSVIWARRLLLPADHTQSSLSTPPKWLNEALYFLTAKEAELVGRQNLRMPAGASIVCRLRKDD
jgi:2-polyprenyl-3-methyl-5-hydroxy-6-metoxy-1,4-benzoquinol methylase